MPGMDLVTTPRPTHMRSPMTWIFGVLLFTFGTWLMGQGLWIHAKAMAAQWLLQRAWVETLESRQPVKPWPWADTWPVARLVIPKLGVDQIILADASGRSLAFGPGWINHRKFPRAAESLLLSGHRDTHFSYLRDVRVEDLIKIQTRKGGWTTYSVINTVIVDTRTTELMSYQDNDALTLITCYPFETLVPGGPLRYVVRAEKVPDFSERPSVGSIIKFPDVALG